MLSSTAAFFWDKVLGDYIAGILTAATSWFGSKAYRLRRRGSRQEQPEE
ncbi:hypothetical protein ACIPYQ_40090 [Streptomyces sp. NPDC090045]